MTKLNDISNVFILSSGRSGSTLLSNILNAHSNLLSVPESSFFITISSLYKRKKHFSNNDYRKIVDTIWLRKREFSYLWNIDEEALLRTLIKEKPQHLNAIFQLIYLSYSGAGAKKPSIIVDKNPFYFQFINQLKKTYPSAKYIFLTRDYRDRYLSLRKSKFSNQIASNLVKGISWNTRNKAIYEILHQIPEKILWVKYEALVTYPEKETQRICKFLNISFEPEMLSFHKTNKHDYHAIEASAEMSYYIEDMHKKSNTKITTNNIGVWKEKLDGKTLKVLEAYCGETGELLGYKKSLHISNFTRIQIKTALLPKIIKSYILLFLKKKSFSLPYKTQKKLVALIKPK